MPDVPPDFTGLGGVVFWADIAYRLGDREAATYLASKLAPYAGIMSFNGISLQGTVADALGAGHRGRPVPGGRSPLRRGHGLNRRLEAPFFVALTTLHRAEMQIRRDVTR